MNDERPRLTFNVGSYEFRDKFRNAFPRGSADAVMLLVMEQLVELLEEQDGNVVIANFLSNNISIKDALKEAYDAHISRIASGK